MGEESVAAMRYLKEFHVFCEDTGEREKRFYNDIVAVNRWINCYGNPSYGVIMSDGEHLRLIDDYEFCESYCPCPVVVVGRKKDLFQ